MKALGYKKAHTLADFEISEIQIPVPKLKPHDVLVKVKALAINPVDIKIRQNRNASGEYVILGWDAAGVIEDLGTDVHGFAKGDEVYYAGDLNRDGSYAEFQAVDHRIIAKKPHSLSFIESAALPLTSLTAWEALLERRFEYTPETKVLVIGGAGGVGSIAVQLLKSETKAKVIATASRPETKAWCEKWGADHVIDHRQNLATELAKLDIKYVDIIFGTTHSADYLTQIPGILKPFGHFVLIDDPKVLDIAAFKSKSLSVHWEFMFAKSSHGYKMETQGHILKTVAHLVDSRKIQSTGNTVLKGLTPGHIRQAHQMIENGTSIGKIVISID
ncbi:hypothetical protein AZI86_16270 [Bdellovibrio bacteriovorus]|uniref:Zinc-type alcohol dehydrogenase-like protein n=1 Tax=Bdellovibrio bacteriovorus TaxID=959 RepID=A0A150WHD4_BDEBC|nr:zinc-binding alcohol dehydrogenase family protein [Bdellovibrio bacteriovorus]KYG62390.1 hypothetical protein AZI86_16270 [Bdellovibrio bacteriovorus]